MYCISSKSRCGEIKVPFDAATIRGRLGHVQRSTHIRILGFNNSLFVILYNVHTHSYVAANPLHVMGRDLKGNIYWDKLAETCGDI